MSEISIYLHRLYAYLPTNIIRISLIFTAPQIRRHGYAFSNAKCEHVPFIVFVHKCYATKQKEQNDPFMFFGDYFFLLFLSREFSKNKQKDVFNQSNMIQHPTTMSMLKFRRIRRRRNKQINNNDNNKEKTIVFCRIQKKDEYYLLGRMRNRSRESID